MLAVLRLSVLELQASVLTSLESSIYPQICTLDLSVHLTACLGFNEGECSRKLEINNRVAFMIKLCYFLRSLVCILDENAEFQSNAKLVCYFSYNFISSS